MGPFQLSFGEGISGPSGMDIERVFGVVWLPYRGLSGGFWGPCRRFKGHLL